MNEVENVAILGAGPAGCALGVFLARDGRNVCLFHRERRTPVLVGESLIPGVIPLLRELGIEDAIESYSQHKPGARFILNDATEFEFRFDEIPGSVETYAYNVPRKPFNRTFRMAAREADVEVLEQKASVRRGEDGTLQLSESCRNALPWSPDGTDLIVDATGRNRLAARCLELPVHRRSRRDASLFTHFDRMAETPGGTIRQDVFDHGWSWRIPLPDRVSFGVVMDRGHLDRHGENPAEKLESVVETHPRLTRYAAPSDRIGPVREFHDFQVLVGRFTGPNWALLGDAIGFLDPIFSSGLYLALKEAQLLAATIREKGLNLESYERAVESLIESWAFLVDVFYDGRLWALFRAGEAVQDHLLGRLINPHMKKHMGRIFTGLAAESTYSLGLLRFMTRFGLRNQDPAADRIQSST